MLHRASCSFVTGAGFEVAPSLSVGCRVVVPDIETRDFMAGTADLDKYRRSNIRA
jgi:hypothetical protein